MIGTNSIRPFLFEVIADVIVVVVVKSSLVTNSVVFAGVDDDVKIVDWVKFNETRSLTKTSTNWLDAALTELGRVVIVTTSSGLKLVVGMRVEFCVW